MGNEITGNAFREWVHSLPDARNHYRERGEIAEIMLWNRVACGSFRTGPLVRAVLADMEARKKEIVRGGVG